ncbi:WhiB family transcriptional regulator [Streptomyces hainanensis]|uniref:Transcriptional regulator WhiB n=2 Tax=Streptomyces hainanensis TaxID=402648 RepID=A0A4R4TDW7_9ACTN|nr:WhiB family transcriptional regulator [Streptomyces hainanensis]
MPKPVSEIPPAHRRLGDQSWQSRGACRGAAADDPDLFFPDADHFERVAEAKRYCARCPVQQVCLDAALENNDRYGIWGGLTEEERDPLHVSLENRLDYGRVEAALAGRDIHLTNAERRAIVRTAYVHQADVEHLARVLKVSSEHAERLLRRARREARHRRLAEAATPLRSHQGTAVPEATLGRAA